jgi:hypothetical protein
MRYRLVLDQVMETWYATVISWEPNGLTVEKHTKHYSFDATNNNLEDLYILLVNMAGALRESQG